MALISSALLGLVHAPHSIKNKQFLYTMVNPFDKSFFKFLLGFAIILVLTFSIIYFAANHLA
jgi:hypothetical protein